MYIVNTLSKQLATHTAFLWFSFVDPGSVITGSSYSKSAPVK